MVRYFGLAALASVLSLVNAQISSECNPLKQTCPSNPGMGPVLDTDFTKSGKIPDGWKLVQQGGATYDKNGANLILAGQGDNPTLETTGYYLFGSLEVVLKAAPGVGVVTSIVMLSDDLDEVDWELIGGNTAQVQSNYFGKGDASTYDRAAWHAVGAPQTSYHSYKVDWTPAALTLYIDGAVVRTINYNDAQGGTRFPQTPMKVRLGIWAGGDPSNNQGTIEWAGGATDYSKAPFAMSVKSVKVVNYTPAKSYSYSDNSGSYQSIKIEGGELLSNKAGTAVSSATTLTTSLSIAKGAPTNPLTAVSVQVASNATATDKLPGSTSSPNKQVSTGAASHLDQTAIGSFGALFAVIMALFA